MNESIQPALNALRTVRAEVGIVFVVMKHAAPISIGDTKTAAKEGLGS